MIFQSEIGKLFKFSQDKVPGQLIIQMTDHCNALCPQCGMRKTAEFERTKLDKDKIKSIIDKAVVNGVEAISFTGGEPMLFFDDLVELIKYAGSCGIKYIRTGTNGYLLREGKNSDEFNTRINRVVEKLAATPIRNFWISIDSADPKTHEQMRGFSGLIKGIEQTLPVFHKAGIYPSANLGINRRLGGRHTEDFYVEPLSQDEAYFERFYREFSFGFKRFFQSAIDLGFTTINMCYPMSVENNHKELNSVYTATSTDKIVNFSKSERYELFRTLLDIVPSYRSQIRIFTPLSSLYVLKEQYLGKDNIGYSCRGGIDFFFINSRDGKTYPCGFRGNESLGDYEQFDPRLVDRQAKCNKCDWECFRDPSIMLGPFMEGLQDPWKLFRKLNYNRKFFELWRSDISYYETCDLFDGRKNIDLLRLKNFKIKETLEDFVSADSTS